MSENSSGQTLKKSLAECRLARGFKTYPEQVRRQAEQYARTRQSQGATVGMIAKELGVAIATAATWACSREVRPKSAAGAAKRENESQGLSIVPVVVRPDVPPSSTAALEIQFRDSTSLRISGIGIQDIALVIETLRRQTCSASR